MEASAQLVAFQTMDQQLLLYPPATPFLVMANRNNDWRICMPYAQPCAPTLPRTDRCLARTPDCRCYNWAFAEYTVVYANVSAPLDLLSDPNNGACVIVRLPPVTANYTFRWQLASTIDTAPSGYMLYYFYGLYSRLITYLTFNQYVSLMHYIACDALHLLDTAWPALDDCTVAFQLNTVVYRDPVTGLPWTQPATVTAHSLAATVNGLAIGATLLALALFVLWWHSLHTAHQHGRSHRE